MEKKSILQIIFGFYRKDVMKYVGTAWKGTGILFLVSICAYFALFISYKWYYQVGEAYENFYEPSIAEIPAFKYENQSFIFEQKMPIEILHPITKEPAIYIDTTKEEFENKKNFPNYILKGTISMGLYPMSHDMSKMLFMSSFKESQTYTGKDVTAWLKTQKNMRIIGVATSAFFIQFMSHLFQTLFISLIVMMMFKNGQLKIKREFKMINRLCILTYMPILLIRAIHLYFSTEMGFFTLIIFSFVHIILLMTAIAVNSEDELKKPPEKKF
jgi:hypothetical protein